jgi:hypothetical protein
MRAIGSFLTGFLIATVAMPVLAGGSAHSGEGRATTVVQAGAPNGTQEPVPSSAAVVALGKAPPALDLSPGVLHQAVKDSIDPADDLPAPPRGAFGAPGPTRQQKIDRAFVDAEIPSCMTMDAWKFAPPMIGFIPIPGFFAAPLWMRNIVTGKCRH